jgi:hypothetical protein
MWAVGIFVGGFVLLCVAGFVRFNHTTGSDGDDWNRPLGFLAAALAIVSVVVALREAAARLWLGVVLAVLEVFLVWQVVANTMFRFVWGRDEYEMLLFQVGLGVLAFALIATGLQPARRSGTDPARPGAGRWLVRVAVYVAVILLAAWIVGLVATGYYERTQCTGMDEDCLAGLGGLIWGFCAAVAGVVAAVVIELVLMTRRRQRVR